MNTGKGLTIAAIATLLGAISLNMHVFESVGTVLSGWIERPAFVAVVVGIASGVLFTTWVPYMLSDFLPSKEDILREAQDSPEEAKARLIAKAKRVDRIKLIIRSATAALAFTVTLRMYPGEFGVVWGMIAAMAAPQAYKTLTWITYLAFPAVKPKALQETAPQLVAAAADIPTEAGQPD